MAEKEGFEPPVELPLQLISSQSHSTTLALLRLGRGQQRERLLQRKIQSKDSERTRLIEPTTYQTDSSSNSACSIQDRYFSQNSATSSRIT